MESNVVSMMPLSSECRLVTATVKSAAEKTAVIETESGIVKATVAFGCLVAPEAGDKVLASFSKREWHVLSVLERPTSRNTRLEFPGDLAIGTSNGKMELAAASDMKILSGSKAVVVSPETRVSTGDLEVSSRKTTARTHSLESHVQEARIFAGSVHTVAKSVTQRFETLMRWVDKVQTLNVGNLIQNVRGALASHSRHAVITAKKDVKIDGERIHMG